MTAFKIKVSPDNFRKLRIENNITQKQIGEKVERCGLTVWRWEQKITIPPPLYACEKLEQMINEKKRNKKSLG